MSLKLKNIRQQKILILLKILKDAYSQYDTERKVACFLFAEFYADCLIFVDEFLQFFFLWVLSFYLIFFSIIFPSIFFISLFFFLLHNKCRKKWREREKEGEWDNKSERQKQKESDMNMYQERNPCEWNTSQVISLFFLNRFFFFS